MRIRMHAAMRRNGILARGGLFAALWLMVAAGCASEEWDNPRDPDSTAYLKPCAGAPAEEQAQCVFYESFSQGLTRWAVFTPAGMTPPHVRSSVLTGEQKIDHVLALPACKPFSHVSVEVPLPPDASLRLSVVWRLAPEAETGDLGLTVAGTQMRPPMQALSGALSGWSESVATFPKESFRNDSRLTLRLWNDAELSYGCEQEVWIESISLSR